VTTDQLDVETYARGNIRTAGDAFDYLADFLEMLDDSAWSSRTQCDKWDMRTLALHALGEAVWFPNLVRNALRGEEMYPAGLYDEMKSWPAERLIVRLREAAGEFPLVFGEASSGDLEREVDLGWGNLPVWKATHIGAMEGVFHGWDARAVLEPGATIPTSWATQIAPGLIELGPVFAHRKGVDASSGTYLLDVGDGIGPVTVTAGEGKLDVQGGTTDSPDITLRLTADQFVRLIVGRLKLDSSKERDRVDIEGDRDIAPDLNRIFGGVANEE
jgi:uncharacterized protein (TIGR03083 family)